MESSVIDEFSIELRDFDVSILPRGSRFRSNTGFDPAFGLLVKRVFSYLGGTAEINLPSEDSAAHVSFSVPRDLETVRDEIIDAVSDWTNTTNVGASIGPYEILEVLRFSPLADTVMMGVLVELSLERRDRHRALEHVQRMLETEGEQAHIMVLLGRVQVAYGELDAAMETFRKACERGPELPDPYIEILNIKLRKRSELKEIQTLVDRILAIDSRNSQALFVRGVILFEQGRNDEGTNTLRSIVQANDAPPIDEYAWKAWVVLNRQFSQRFAENTPDLRLSSFMPDGPKLLPAVKGLDANQMRTLAWHWFREDYHERVLKKPREEFYIDALGSWLEFKDIIVLLWIVFAIIAPRRDIGFSQVRLFEGLFMIFERTQPFTGERFISTARPSEQTETNSYGYLRVQKSPIFEEHIE